MDRGPVEVLVLSFPLGTDPGSVTAAIRGPVDAGTIRLIDLVLVLRDEHGEPDIRDVEDELPAGVDAIAMDPHTLLSDDDVEMVLEVLPADRQAAVLAIEHRWATEAKGLLDKAGAELALYVRVPPTDAEAAFAAAP
jgi:hypothetical protein